MTTLPIMLFNERTLTPSFGYVFDPKWLDPYESIVSILWKLVRMNRLSGHMVISQLAINSNIDPYVGIAASQSEVDIRRLHQALGLQQKILRGSLAIDSSTSRKSPYFRYCRKCLWRGYHGVVHQFEIIKVCPVHGCQLEVECGDCGAKMPYWLNANILDSHYRCGFCHKFYALRSPAIASRRPMSKDSRMAITRSRINHCLYF